MAKIPYLIRRGNNFFFRMVIPADIRSLTQRREVTKTLQTQDYSEAAPAALRLASVVKNVFNRLRVVTDKNEIDALIALMQLDALDDHRLNELDKALQREIGLNEGKTFDQIIQHHKLKQQKFTLQDQHVSTLASMRTAHLVALKEQQQTFNDINKVKDNVIRGLSESASAGSIHPLPTITETDSSLMLSDAINRYIEHYATLGKREMLEKIKSTVQVLFIGITGDKPIKELSKRDLINFFDEAQKLPRTWKAEHIKGLSIKEIIARAKGKSCLAEGTLKNTYKTAIGGFLNWCHSQLYEEGFPLLQITKHDITYRGDKRIGDGSQRNFSTPELQKLFEGSEMERFAKTKAELHKYWLPHIGLFTGARINEICQLNPQKDIYEANGVWCFKFTEETEADDDVVKSIKKSATRICPIHSKLIELGFLKYLTSLREQKAKRMFPAWKVIGGNAAAKAGQWFSEHLVALNLRDETPGKKISGFHAFRHTFVTHAENHDITKFYAISGHVDKNVPDSARVYIHGKDEAKLQKIIEAFDFGLKYHDPISP